MRCLRLLSEPIPEKACKVTTFFSHMQISAAFSLRGRLNKQGQTSKFSDTFWQQNTQTPIYLPLCLWADFVECLSRPKADLKTILIIPKCKQKQAKRNNMPFFTTPVILPHCFLYRSGKPHQIWHTSLLLSILLVLIQKSCAAGILYIPIIPIVPIMQSLHSLHLGQKNSFNE